MCSTSGLQANRGNEQGKIKNLVQSFRWKAIHSLIPATAPPLFRRQVPLPNLTDKLNLTFGYRLAAASRAKFSVESIKEFSIGISASSGQEFENLRI